VRVATANVGTLASIAATPAPVVASGLRHTTRNASATASPMVATIDDGTQAFELEARPSNEFARDVRDVIQTPPEEPD
jgi:hypothetical protein